MYKVSKILLEGDAEYVDASKSRKKNKEKINVERETIFYSKKEAAVALQDEIEWLEKGTRIYSQAPIDVEKSSYNLDEENITESYVEIYADEFIIPGSHYRDGNLIISCGARKCEKQHYKIIVTELENDLDIENVKDELVKIYKPLAEQYGAEMNVSAHLHYGEVYQDPEHLPVVISFNKSIEVVSEYNKGKQENHEVARIIIYKVDNVMCIRACSNYRKIPLLKDQVTKSSTTWYENLPTSHTNYLYNEKNLEKLLPAIVKRLKYKTVDKSDYNPKYK